MRWRKQSKNFPDRTNHTLDSFISGVPKSKESLDSRCRSSSSSSKSTQKTIPKIKISASSGLEPMIKPKPTPFMYPNYPQFRQYQYFISIKCVTQNTLVCLPTGLGKTHIASVLMVNFHLWFPQGLIFFLAPTKPLVSQQKMCLNNFSQYVPLDCIIQITGQMPAHKRSKIYQKKRVFFCTPQTLQNDLQEQRLEAKKIVLLIIDQAHRAVGNYAYAKIVRNLDEQRFGFRLVGLSATPGNDSQKIQQVINNLLISNMIVKNQSDPDVKKYIKNKKIQPIYIQETSIIKQIQKILQQFIRWPLNQMLKFHLFDRFLIGNNGFNPKSFFMVLKQSNQRINNLPNVAVSMVLSARCFLKFLCDSLLLLRQSGYESFKRKFIYQINMVQPQNKQIENLMPEKHKINDKYIKVLKQHEGFKRIMELFQNNASEIRHPKLQKLREILYQYLSKQQNIERKSKIIIFANLRFTCFQIHKYLSQPPFNNIIKSAIFLGQSKTTVQTRDLQNNTSTETLHLSQKQQIKMIKKFKNNQINTLISTSIGEQGLDIGQVDGIFCYDGGMSTIRLVQRMGRTGRKRDGAVYILLMQGKQAEQYQKANKRKQKVKKINQQNNFKFYSYNPTVLQQCTEIPIIFFDKAVTCDTCEQIKQKQDASQSKTKRKKNKLNEDSKITKKKKKQSKMQQTKSTQKIDQASRSQQQESERVSLKQDKSINQNQEQSCSNLLQQQQQTKIKQQLTNECRYFRITKNRPTYIINRQYRMEQQEYDEQNIKQYQQSSADKQNSSISQYSNTYYFGNEPKYSIQNIQQLYDYGYGYEVGNSYVGNGYDQEQYRYKYDGQKQQSMTLDHNVSHVQYQQISNEGTNKSMNINDIKDSNNNKEILYNTYTNDNNSITSITNNKITMNIIHNNQNISKEYNDKIEYKQQKNHHYIGQMDDNINKQQIISHIEYTEQTNNIKNEQSNTYSQYQQLIYINSYDKSPQFNTCFNDSQYNTNTNDDNTNTNTNDYINTNTNNNNNDGNDGNGNNGNNGNHCNNEHINIYKQQKQQNTNITDVDINKYSQTNPKCSIDVEQIQQCSQVQVQTQLQGQSIQYYNQKCTIAQSKDEQTTINIQNTNDLDQIDSLDQLFQQYTKLKYNTNNNNTNTNITNTNNRQERYEHHMNINESVHKIEQNILNHMQKQQISTYQHHNGQRKQNKQQCSSSDGDGNGDDDKTNSKIIDNCSSSQNSSQIINKQCQSAQNQAQQQKQQQKRMQQKQKQQQQLSQQQQLFMQYQKIKQLKSLTK